MCALAIAAVGLSAMASASPASASSSLALGIAVFQPTAAFQDYQSAVGSLPSFLEWYRSWPNSIAGVGSDAPLFSPSQEQLVEADHLVPLISWGTENLPLPSIIDGSEDAIALAPAAALAKAYPGTLYIRLDWEMNGAWSGWNPDNAAQAGLDETPATYVAMWRHVVNYFRAAGVTNVKWVWSPNVDGGTGTMAPYYPGDSYVDEVGLDGYNYAYTQGASWLTPEQVFGASYAEMEDITSKPVIITETSSVEANSTEAAEGLSEAQWMEQLSTYLPTLDNLIGVCWFNQLATVSGYGAVDFSVNTSSASLAAWEQYFVDNPAYQGTLVGGTQTPNAAVTTTTAAADNLNEAPGTSKVRYDGSEAQPAADTPETPFPLLLPVVGLVLFGVAYLRRRRRQGVGASVRRQGGEVLNIEHSHYEVGGSKTEHDLSRSR